MTSEEIDDIIKVNTSIIKKLTKENERLFIKREIAREIENGQIILEGL